MLNKHLSTLAVIASAAAGLGLSGCGLTFELPPIPLNGDLARFLVTAGTPTQKSFTTTVGNGGVMIGAGSIRIDPSAISVSPL